MGALVWPWVRRSASSKVTSIQKKKSINKNHLEKKIPQVKNTSIWKDRLIFILPLRRQHGRKSLRIPDLCSQVIIFEQVRGQGKMDIIKRISAERLVAGFVDN